MVRLRFLLVISPRWDHSLSAAPGSLVGPGTRLPIRLVASRQRSLTSNLRSHRSTLLPTTLCQSAAVASLAGVVGPLVVWCLSPWAWQGGARVASDAQGLVAPRSTRSSRSRLVSHLATRGSRGRGVVGDLRPQRDRPGPVAGGGARWTTWWGVDSRLARWCRVASTVISHSHALAVSKNLAVACFLVQESQTVRMTARL
jgi:hypothetical protein